ncbi:TPA: P-loop NTPase fold protein, partial [Vibrio cholerae]
VTVVVFEFGVMRCQPLRRALAISGGIVIIKAKEIEVVAGNPFQNDKLSRKENAEILTEFVCSSSEPMVVCIDAPWGQGKTTFLRMWEQHLKDNKVPTLYFNAWENDFTDDAFVSLIGEIGSAIETLTNAENESKTKEYYQKAKRVGLGLVKRSIPVATKIATAGVLDLDKVTEQALSSFAESVANDQIEKYEKAKKTLGSFREHLADFADSVASKNEKPLVFIIDELDRCRPNFSIEILEKAKHFFNVPNIIFVLGADKEQLGH